MYLNKTYWTFSRLFISKNRIKIDSRFSTFLEHDTYCTGTFAQFNRNIVCI